MLEALWVNVKQYRLVLNVCHTEDSRLDLLSLEPVFVVTVERMLGAIFISFFRLMKFVDRILSLHCILLHEVAVSSIFLDVTENLQAVVIRQHALMPRPEFLHIFCRLRLKLFGLELYFAPLLCVIQ